jgi:hypothetical protein
MQPKLILFAAIMAMFTACNNAGSTSESANAEHESMHQHDATTHEHSAGAAHGLSLNNGQKWQTDESTRKHATKLNNMINDFEKQTDKSVPAHHSFADKTQEELQQLINNCTMEGPDHDALHLWLEPVLNDVKTLKNTASDEEAQTAAATLSGDVRKYNEFFN